MNLADYISELLLQHDEVSIPGLGYFERERINAYYNDRESKFYPPSHKAKFASETRDDDTFAQYIASKKNISLASSKYFTEKFVIKLKEDAANGTYLFAGLGSFHTSQDQLVFKPNEKIADDPSFYGYPAVHIDKIEMPLFTAHTKHVFAEPITAPVITAVPAQAAEPQQYFEEEAEGKKRRSIWLILLIIIVAIALALFAFYEIYPARFNELSGKLTGSYSETTGNEPAVIVVVKKKVKPDTITKKVVADTTSKSTAVVTPVSGQATNATDTAKSPHWEIIVGAFKTQTRANAEIERYKAIGVDAKIVTGAPGNRLNLSVGTYPTRDLAEAARVQLVNSHKISESSYPLEIKSQK